MDNEFCTPLLKKRYYLITHRLCESNLNHHCELSKGGHLRTLATIPSAFNSSITSGTTSYPEESSNISTELPIVQSSNLPKAIERASLCARIARDHKAKDIRVLDLRKLTPLYDFFVIASGTSRRQIHTIAEEIDSILSSLGDLRIGIEGYEVGKWVVQDYSDVLIHLFDPITRDYYNLEELWADASLIDWERE